MSASQRVMRLVRKFEIWQGHWRRNMSWQWRKWSQPGRLDLPRISRHWVFLVGCNNSGTTILHDLLQKTGHFAYMDHEGQRYTRVLNIAERKGFERVWSEYIDNLRMTEFDKINRADRLAHDWLYRIHNPAKKFVLEKTTANSVRTQWLQKAFPNSYFICVVRNGYAVCEGIRRKGKKDLHRAAQHWCKVNEILSMDACTLRRRIEVRYEDLVDNPTQVIADVFELLCISDPDVAHRIDTGHLKNMNAKSLAALSEEDRATIESVSSTMLKKYGYCR